MEVSDSYEVAIGNRALITEEGVAVDADTEERMREHENSGHTAVLMTVDGKYCVCVCTHVEWQYILCVCVFVIPTAIYGTYKLYDVCLYVCKSCLYVYISIQRLVNIMKQQIIGLLLKKVTITSLKNF